MNPSQANSLLFFFFFFFFFFLNHHHNHYVSAQSQYPPPPYPLYLTNDLYKPSLAIITGVFSIVFTLTFVLLVYAKCFSNDLRSETDVVGDRDHRGIFNLSSRFSSSSGLNKTAIESLPFFRFSALKGSKQGLECSVCLSKFEDVEILRLLPKCKHAFHISCIDTWLEQHATCPLCRNIVSVEDDISVLGFSSNNNNNSLRLMNQSLSRQDQDQDQEQDFSLEIYIEREEEGIGSEGSSRFSSFRKILNFGKKETALFLDEQGNEKKPMHKFNHRIFVSDLTFKNRWSNVTSSDLNYLTSEMLNSMSSDRFSSLDRVNGGNLCYKEDVKMKKKKKESTRRAVSEITGVPRVSIGGNGSVLDAFTASTSKNDETEERRRRLWLPIASRTAHWFVNRDKSNEVNVTRQNLNV
ncbi:unnamed protein product [Cochlearia groenlandica]